MEQIIIEHRRNGRYFNENKGKYCLEEFYPIRSWTFTVHIPNGNTGKKTLQYFTDKKQVRCDSKVTKPITVEQTCKAWHFLVPWLLFSLLLWAGLPAHPWKFSLSCRPCLLLLCMSSCFTYSSAFACAIPSILTAAHVHLCLLPCH